MPELPSHGWRVLVVAYYFPPAGGPGVQRVLKTVKYLVRLGWSPEVLTVEQGAFPHTDLSLMADVPAGVNVVRTRSLDPLRLYARLAGRTGGADVPVGSAGGGETALKRVARWVRANVFLPDARVGWVPYGRAAARRLHRQTPYDVVLTSGPPHSTHFIGHALARTAGVPWVADFRDPWTGINFYHELPMTRAARALDRRLEATVLREATLITTVSPTWSRSLATRAGRPEADVPVVHNGFDADDFAGPAPDVAAGRFTLAHVGSLYGSRDPSALWEALARLRAAGRLERFQLRLVGGVDERVSTSAMKAGLSDLVVTTGYVDHASAVRAMREATALLLVVEGFAEDRGMITGKVYEYLGAGRPVVGLGPADGDAADLLRETGAGAMVDRQDAPAIATRLDDLITRFEHGEALGGADQGTAALYTREAQAEVMSSVLRRAVERS